MKNIILKLLNNTEKNRKFASFTNEPDLSYSELTDYSNGVSEQFNSLGMLPQSKIILLGLNTRSFIFALVASWLNRAIVLPEDLNIDEGRLSKIRDSFNPDFIINSGDMSVLQVSNNTKHSYKEVCLKFNSVKINYKNFKENDISLCIYTSGSTGEPKGVLLSHKALYNGAINVIENFKIKASDRAFCVLPMTHINGIVTTFIAPLASLSEVYYYQGIFDAKRAVNEVIYSKSTWFSAIPMHYSLLSEYPIKKEQLNNMRLNFCRSASAALSEKVLKKFERRYFIPLIETMGMTETSGQIFANPLPPLKHKPNSVGKPINFFARIVDDNGNKIPVNKVGNLEVKGNSMMESYIYDKESTKKAYNHTWLITGDLACIDEDGYFYLKGRKKNIAIYSGINISLSSIDTFLKNFDEIHDAVSIAKDHKNIGQRVIILIIFKRNYKLNKTVFINSLREKLRSYLPSINALEDIIELEKFPRTSVGKVDSIKLQRIIKNRNKLISKKSDLTAINIISNRLNIPMIRLNKDSKLGDFKEWDSLGNVLLISAIEELLDKELKKDELIKVRTVKGIESLLQSK